MENVLLSVRHLKKAFGDHMIFEDFDLDVRKGEVVVVIGPSGCGKSTLLRCLNGLEPIQGGRNSAGRRAGSPGKQIHHPDAAEDRHGVPEL